MKKMKKIKFVMTMAMVFATGFNLIAITKANAALLIPLSFATGNPEIGITIGVVGFSTFVLGPIADAIDGEPSYFSGTDFSVIVFLDKKLASLLPITARDLVDNGYSEAQADKILQDNTSLNEKLFKEKKVISLTHGISEAKIREILAEFMKPEAVSDEFLNEYSKRLYVISQTGEGPGARE